jgi:hypothetical protein
VSAIEAIKLVPDLQVVLGKGQALEWLLLLDNRVDNRLEWLVVRLLYCSLLWESHLVVEAILDWRTNAEITSKSTLRRLSQDMCARVPEDLLALCVVEWQELQLAALLQRSLKIPKRLLRCALVQTCDDGALEQALRDVSCNVRGARDP